MNGKKEGDGSETYLSGYVYAGSFANDKPHGKGVLLKGNHSYDGEFSEGKKHGYGVEQYPNGSVYEGQFANNRKFGKGKLKKKDGNLFMRTNLEAIILKNVLGSYYQGEWYDDLKHGYGAEIIVDSTGETIYEGEFRYGLKDGFGRLTLPNDSYYYGYWHLNCKHGEFLHFDKDSEKYTLQYFQNDEEVESKECPQKFPPELGITLMENFVF